MKEREALQKIANKNNQPLATTINGLRTQLRFVLNIATEALKEPTESGIPSDKDLDFDSQYQKLFNAIADSGGTPLESEMQDIIRIVHRDFPFEPTESYSEEELAKLFHDTYERLAPEFGYATREDTKVFDQNSANGKLMVAVCEVILQSLSPKKGKEEKEEVRTYTYRELECFGIYLMSGDYIHTITNNQELVQYCKKQAEHFLQSLSPKEVKEEVNPIATLPIPCNNFEGSYATSSATKCKWCGLEEWQHRDFKRLSILPESSNPIATDHTRLEPNQTEAENRSLRKIATEIMDKEYSFFTPDTRKKMVLSFCNGYTLSRKQVIEEVEDWVNELRKNSTEPITNLAIPYTILLTKLSKLK